MIKYLFCIAIPIALFSFAGTAQKKITWSTINSSYYTTEDGEIFNYILPANSKKVILAKQQLVPSGFSTPIIPSSFYLSRDESKILIYTNTKKVWRYETRGDYWIFDKKNNSLKQIGRDRPPSSLMFAKLSPDGSKAAYVSGSNIYAEDLTSGTTKQLTNNGTINIINGTFDWAYEEEFFCRDGFRWSPDSKHIAYWQIDARKTKNYTMFNLTDSIYPVLHQVEYPIAGDPPSPFRIGVVDIASASTKWMNIATDTILQTYITRMEWAASSGELIVQQLNRKQNESRLLLCNVQSGAVKNIYTETDSAWIDIISLWDTDYIWGGWNWLNNGKEFVWASEKDGWRHLYRISRDGKKETLITSGNFDVIDIVSVNEKTGYLYFLASPSNATQKYLYRTALKGRGRAERITPQSQPGTHAYSISPDAKFAYHTFSNIVTSPVTEFISLSDHKGLNGENQVQDALIKSENIKTQTVFFKINTAENVEMDAWMVKPDNFDSTKKYPVVFYVYTEPWGQNVKDEFGADNNFLYQGNMSNDGYIYISIDNRGTPVPKGRAWRKSIYRKIGEVNIRDQAMAAMEILKWPFIDTARVAVWGWSGGGSATLNLMFKYPDIYKTGISIAALGNLFTYDNIYQERYMGLPQENPEDYIAGSPVNHAKHLKGHLLYIHGTGDDNVHYNNAEMLYNELIKYNKQFQVMPYPNRTHSISEGEGTLLHLSTLYTQFLKTYCPPGPK